MSDESTRDLVKQFINKDVIFRCNPEKAYNDEVVGKVLSPSILNVSGNDWIVFMRRLTHNIEMMNHVMKLMDSMFPRSAFQLAGLETGSIPVITHMQWHLLSSRGIHVNAFTIRKDRKSSGLFNWIEGIPNRLPIIYVDDLANTGNSINRAQSIVLRELGLIATCKKISIITNNSQVDGLFQLSEFDFEYNHDIYWEPADVRKTNTQVSDYSNFARNQ